MTDWGVPDWRTAGDYPDVSDWLLPRWIWAVVRRHADYRKEAMAFVRIVRTREAAALAFQRQKTSTVRQRFTSLADSQQTAFEAYWHKWGYSEVLDPRVSNYTNDQLLRAGHKGAGVSFVAGSPDERSFLRGKLEPESSEIAILLSSDKPYEQQLASARKVLEQAQIKRHGKKLGPQPGINGISETKRQTWLKFLRVLDADNLKVSPYEIAKQLDLVPERNLLEAHDAHDMLGNAGKSVRRQARKWSANITEISHPATG